MVIQTKKKKPGKTQDENDAVEDYKAGEGRFSIIFSQSVKPENLG